MRKILLKKAMEARQIDQLRYHYIQSKFIPHFMRNVLNSINYLIRQKPELSQKYIDEFSVFSERTLLSSDRLCWTFKEEINYVTSYLNLEKLRFEEQLEYTVNIAPDVPDGLLIPKMILNTFCENAIKHGFRHKEGVRKLCIEARKDEPFILLSVEDNGIGRQKSAELNTHGTQEGLKIIEQQLLIYKRTQRKRAFMSIIDLYDAEGKASGTRCEVRIFV
jgi:sensor histidine kinase YesM